MRRRTKRTRLRPRPFILLGLAVNLVVGVAYSPVTAIRRVRVEGAPKADEVRLTKLVQKLRGVPCIRIDPRFVESEALQNPELRSATLSRTPFGSAVLRVGKRTPVARVFAAPSVGLTAQGVLYAATELPETLPAVKLPNDYPVVSLTLGNGWRTVDVARLAGLVQGLPSGETARIDLENGGRVCLNIGGGRVILGSCHELDKKVALLGKFLRDRPTLFVNFASVNLVDADAPTFTPQKGPSKP